MTEPNIVPTITKEIINNKLHVSFNNGDPIELKTVETCINNPDQCFLDTALEVLVHDQKVSLPFKTILPNVAIISTVDVKYDIPRKTVINGTDIQSVGGSTNIIEEAIIEPNTVVYIPSPQNSGLYASKYYLYNSHKKTYNSVTTKLYDEWNLSKEIDNSLAQNELIGRRYIADLTWRRTKEEVIKEDTGECIVNILKSRGVKKLV